VSVPEKEGVSSAGIIDFLDAAAKSKTEFHSIMILRHGKVIAGAGGTRTVQNLSTPCIRAAKVLRLLLLVLQ
jgi:hypothetical protein